MGRNGRQTEAGVGRDQGSDSDLGVRLHAAASARESRARRAGFLRARPALGSRRAAARPRSQDSPSGPPASECWSLLSCGAQAPAPLFLEPWVSWAATHLLEAQKPRLRLGILNAPHQSQRQNSPHPLLSGTFSSLFNYDFHNSLLRRTVPSPKQNPTFPYPEGSAF